MSDPEFERSSAPIFILGTMRSGTTLMRLILNRHPHIEVGPESGFMRAVQRIKTIPDWNFGKDWYQRFGLTEEDMNRRIQGFYGEIFEQHAARQGKRRWGEKTPFHRLAMGEMAEIFPNALFIVMLRHPGAVAMSLKKWNYEVEKSVKDWLSSNRRMRKVTARLEGHRVLWCRYEDLVSRPELTTRAVMEFLGEPWGQELLEVDRTSDAVLEGGTRAQDPIDASRIDRWRKKISPGEETLIQRLAGKALEEFGYAARTAMPVGELQP